MTIDHNAVRFSRPLVDLDKMEVLPASITSILSVTSPSKLMNIDISPRSSAPQASPRGARPRYLDRESLTRCYKQKSSFVD